MTTPVQIDKISKQSYLIAFFIALLSFIIYVKTMAPTITFQDAGDLASAAAVLGIPHPPGYPLYTLISFLLTKIPFADVAYRLALFSAFSASVAIFYFTLAGLRLSGSIIAAAIGSLAIAFSPIFWSRALIVETYSLNLLFVALLIYSLLVWDQNGRENKYLYRFFFLLGLSLTHHPTVVLLVPAFLFFILDSKARPSLKSFGVSLGFFAAPLSIYAYLPLRAIAGPAKNWGDPSTWSRFLDHVLVSQYRSSLQVFPIDLFISRLYNFPGLLLVQYNWALIAVGLIGFVFLFIRNFKNWLALALMMTAIVVFFARNNASDHTVFVDNFMTAYALWGLFIAIGASYIMKSIPIRATANASVGAIGAFLIIILAAGNYQAVDRHDYLFTAQFIDYLFKSLPENSIILTDSDNFLAPLEYAQIVERRRLDIVSVSVSEIQLPWYRKQLDHKGVKTPATPHPDTVLADLIKLNFNRPIFLTSADDIVLDKYKVKPDGLMLRVTKGSSAPWQKLSSKFSYTGELDDDAKSTLALPLLNLGLLYLDEQKPDKAKSAFKEGSRMAPDDIRFYPMLARIALGQNDPWLAIDLLNKGIEIDRSYALNHAYMVEATSRINQQVMAFESARRAVALNPYDFENTLRLSGTYAHIGEFDEAFRLAFRAFRLNPKDIRTHLALMEAAKGLVKE